MQAYFDFVDDPGGAFRLIFESDLTNEAAVRERVDRTNDACAAAREPGHRRGHRASPRDEAMLLAAGLTGLAQTAARHWLREDQPHPEGRRGRGSWARSGGAASRSIPLSHPPA